MNLVTQGTEYQFTHPELVLSFESMLALIYKRDIMIQGSRQNGIEVGHLQDHASFESFIVKNLAMLRSDKKHAAHSIERHHVIPAALSDAVLFYKRHRYTMTYKKKWIITSQTEVW